LNVFVVVVAGARVVPAGGDVVPGGGVTPDPDVPFISRFKSFWSLSKYNLNRMMFDGLYLVSTFLVTAVDPSVAHVSMYSHVEYP
jgi:hypothetical protein